MKNISMISIIFIITFCFSCSQHLKRTSECNEFENSGVVRNENVEVINTDWGSLQWLVSGKNGLSKNMTLGRVTFKQGQANPPHYHPNCEEILYVVSGEIEHSLPGGGTAILKHGDCIVLPKGVKHNAKNIGSKEAVVIVAFDSAFRETIGE